MIRSWISTAPNCASFIGGTENESGCGARQSASHIGPWLQKRPPKRVGAFLAAPNAAMRFLAHPLPIEITEGDP
jgi:hypothetical protein